uniref:Uncharacterized protein n=1 Tax=Glossina palpalis gambiensis TaxID=67801 RepID=A0A1B0BFH9_9MUSC
MDKHFTKRKLVSNTKLKRNCDVGGKRRRSYMKHSACYLSRITYRLLFITYYLLSITGIISYLVLPAAFYGLSMTGTSYQLLAIIWREGSLRQASVMEILKVDGAMATPFTDTFKMTSFDYQTH